MTWTKWKIEKGQVVPDAIFETAVSPHGHMRYTSPLKDGGIQIDISVTNYSNVPITVVVKR